MADHFLRKIGILTTTAGLLAIPAKAQETRASSPYLRRAVDADQRAPVVIAAPRPDAVILRSEQPRDVVQSLPVKRQIPLSSIRSKPLQMLGSNSLNFKPMLDNPRAPFNVAAKLRIMPQVAEVLADETTAYEIDQGVVVRSALTYRLKSGACSDFLRLAALSTTGVQCAAPVSDAAFSNKKDAHYVADPAKRAKAIADAKVKRETMRQDIAADVADLRASFGDRARYVELTAQLGDAEVSRLAALTDEQLTQELVNSAETTVDQTFYIPLQELPNFQLAKGMRPRNATSRKALPPEGEGEKLPPKIGKVAPAEETALNLKPRIFLTGFTLGRGYEWRQQVTKTIKWCVVGCKKSYYAEIYAGFGLGFGLRFPLQLSGLYQYRNDSKGERASVTPNFVPINGSEADYTAAGLPSLQIFKGKELVAEAQAYAGIGFKLPVIGGGGSPEPLKVGQDYTEGLPDPYTGGQFQPPV
jgi:hypothetical protein